MQVTVLGKSPSWQDAGGACSGYLVAESGHLLLLDCGNGVFGKLRDRADYTAVDTVLISHVHADHVFDLIPFSFALCHGAHRVGPDGTRHRPRLLLPAGGHDRMRGITELFGAGDLVGEAFAIEEYSLPAELTAGPLRLKLAEVPHFATTAAVDISSTTGGGRLTYSADCGPNDALVELARETDVLVIEATLTESGDPEDGRGHLTAAEAGRHGRLAGARRLVLTHISDQLDLHTAAASATGAFGGPVEIAAEGMTFSL